MSTILVQSIARQVSKQREMNLWNKNVWMIMISCILFQKTTAYHIDQMFCGIRFYTIKNFQGSYWSFYNNKWHFKDEKHYNETGYNKNPNRNLFRPKSIRVYADNSTECIGHWRICIRQNIKPKKNCKQIMFLESKTISFPHLRGMKISKYRIGQMRIKHLLKTRKTNFAKQKNKVMSHGTGISAHKMDRKEEKSAGKMLP